ncbi:MAG: L-threonylcarbamoyladenylate synthase [Succinivibrionaceae bacterium]
MSTIQEATKVLLNGGVISYPTESVYGIGCDPDNAIALSRIVSLKSRDQSKGMIIVAASVEQVIPYIDISKVDKNIFSSVTEHWPGFVTYILPVSKKVHPLLKGKHDTIAVRVSSFKIIHDLCLDFGKPIVSTSCNKSGQEPLRSYSDVVNNFGSILDYIVDGFVGGENNPSKIINAITGIVIRD